MLFHNYATMRTYKLASKHLLKYKYSTYKYTFVIYNKPFICF